MQFPGEVQLTPRSMAPPVMLPICVAGPQVPLVSTAAMGCDGLPTTLPTAVQLPAEEQLTPENTPPDVTLDSSVTGPQFVTRAAPASAGAMRRDTRATADMQANKATTTPPPARRFEGERPVNVSR